MKHSSEKQSNILTNDQLSIPDINEEKLQKQPDFLINNQQMEQLDLPEIKRIGSDFLANNQHLDKLVIPDIDEEKLDKKQETQAPSNKINELQEIKKIIQNSMDKDNTKEISDTLDNDTETKGRTR